MKGRSRSSKGRSRSSSEHRRANDPRGSATRHDTVRSDTVRSDTVRSDTVRSDTVRSDTGRSDTGRSDTFRPDTVRSERDDDALLTAARRQGMSLAAKSTLVSSAMIAVLLTTFGFVAYTTSSGALQREIDVFGANLARSLALPDPASWKSDHGSLHEAASRVAERGGDFEAVLRADYGIALLDRDDRDSTARNGSGAGAGSGSGSGSGDRTGASDGDAGEELRRERRRFQEELGKIEERNRQRLRPLARYGNGDGAGLASEIVDAFIRYEDRDTSVARADLQAPAFRPIEAERAFVVERGGRRVRTETRITEGRFEGLGAARMFHHPIRDASGTITHRAYVFVSERSIHERLGRLLRRIALLTIVFVAAGAAITFGLTRHLTAPLSVLVRDIEIVSRGNLAHRTHARTSDEIGVLAKTFDRMVRSLDEARVDRTKHRELAHEKAVAAEVQAKLLPDGIPVVPGYALDVLRIETGEIGGSYHDFLELPAGGLGLVVAEASGLGVPAAMTVTMARTLLRSESERESDPAELLARVNESLARDLRKGLCVSALFATLDPPTRRLRVAGAGRSGILIARADGTVETVVPDGIVLGLVRGPVLTRAVRAVDLELDEGDRLLFHTGSPERIRDASGEELGDARLAAVVGKLAASGRPDFLPKLRAALERFRGTAPPDETVVIVSLRVGPRDSIE